MMMMMILTSTLPGHRGLRQSPHYNHHHHQYHQNDNDNDNVNIHLAKTSRAEAKSSFRKIGASMSFAALPRNDCDDNGDEIHDDNENQNHDDNNDDDIEEDRSLHALCCSP